MSLLYGAIEAPFSVMPLWQQADEILPPKIPAVMSMGSRCECKRSHMLCLCVFHIEKFPPCQKVMSTHHKLIAKSKNLVIYVSEWLTGYSSPFAFFLAAIALKVKCRQWRRQDPAWQTSSLSTRGNVCLRWTCLQPCSLYPQSYESVNCF